jgi:hypothetical protein
MGMKYLAALIPLAWGAFFWWQINKPGARRVNRDLTFAERAAAATVEMRSSGRR